MNPEEESLYAEMRAVIRADQERVAMRAEQRAAQSAPTPEPAPTPEREPAATDEPKPRSGMRRLFGRRDPS